MLYTSIDNKNIKDIKKLTTKKYRDKVDKFLVEGEHLVLEAYKKGFLETLIVEKDTLFVLDIDTIYVTNNIINYISELDNPQNIMGICKKISNNSIGNRVLALENIQDPGNLGTIIRSAVAFNIDTIILSPECVDLYNSKVIRATQGLLFHIDIVKKDLMTFLPSLKDLDYKIYSTRVTHGKSLKTIEKKSKFVIIMGNEGNGVTEELNEISDEFIYIDTNPNCESLNVGVATSIILYELDK